METHLQDLLEMRKKEIGLQGELVHESESTETKNEPKVKKVTKRKTNKDTSILQVKISRKSAPKIKKGTTKKSSKKNKGTVQETLKDKDVCVLKNKFQKENNINGSEIKLNTSPLLNKNDFSESSIQGSEVGDAATKSKRQKSKTTKLKSPEKNEIVNIQEDVDNKTRAEITDNNSNISNNIVDDVLECHSILEGKKLLAWLMHPIDLQDFFNESWEKQPLHIARAIPMYYANVISTQEIDNVLRFQRLDYTKHIDITSYENGVRETHNPTGRALAPVVWDFYLNGYSIRMLNPQAFIPKLHLLCATLQEFFSCMVGANTYLTPPGSQGFAPHYDDIEAFVIQVEGKKHWKLYSPRNPSEVLPRVSSHNFKREELGDLIMDVVLKPGDLLYFPRGTVHEAKTLNDDYSLHVTISVCQKRSWGDLLEKVVPIMVARAISEDVSFRKGLPLDLPNHLGLVHSDETSARRQELIKRFKEMLLRVIEYAPLDAAVDQICKEFQHSALPPALNALELSCTAFGDGEIMKANGVVDRKVQLSLDTNIRLIRANVLRMLLEENSIRVYYSIDNTKEYQEIEPQYMEVDETQAVAIEYLMNNYPRFSAISDLPMDQVEEKVNLIQNLWEKGLLLTDKPLPTKN